MNQFIEDLAADGVKFSLKDIILVGSNVSYNYTENSDLDIHIIADKDSLDCNPEVYDKLYSAYRSLFNKNYNVTIKDIPVEIYVELGESKTKSNGIYSINQGWLKHPTQENIPDIDQEEFEKEFKVWENRYFDLVENTSLEQIDKFIEDIYNLRKESITNKGEYGLGNLIFKEFRNLGYLDDLKEWRKEEISKELSLEQLQEDNLLESKQDINAFINKFGQDTYDEFKKSSQRLKNNGYSTDIIKYTKDDSWTKEKLDKLLFNLSNKLTVSKDDSTEIEGKYIDLGIQGDYHIYEPLDVLASMNLGVGSGWCTTGRYGHYGDKNFKPSLKDAKKHWDSYIKHGVRFFYYLDKDTNLAKYAIAVYPKLLNVNRMIGENYISRTNFEIYDVKDELDYSVFNKLPTNNLGVELVLEAKSIIQNNVIYTVKNNIKTKFAEIKDDTLYIEDGIKDLLILDNILPRNKIYKIKNVIIPNSVEKIGDYVFYSCTPIESITIPNSVKRIGNNAFYNCSSLKSINIPNSVKEIGSWAFSYCSSLKSTTIPKSVKEIWYYTFWSCASLESISIPNSVEKIGDQAFAYCTSLKSISIPNSVKEIGDYVFWSCISLKSAYIPNSVEKMGSNVFGSSPNLTIYCEAESQPEGWNENWNPDDIPVVWGYKDNKVNEDLSLKLLKESKKLSLESLKEDLSSVKYDTLEDLANLKSKYNIKEDGTYTAKEDELVKVDLTEGFQVSFFRPEITNEDIKEILNIIGNSLGEVYLGLFEGSEEISYCVDNITKAMNIANIFNQYSIWDNKNQLPIDNPDFDESLKVNYKEAIEKLKELLKKA